MSEKSFQEQLQNVKLLVPKEDKGDRAKLDELFSGSTEDTNLGEVDISVLNPYFINYMVKQIEESIKTNKVTPTKTLAMNWMLNFALGAFALGSMGMVYMNCTNSDTGRKFSL